LNSHIKTDFEGREAIRCVQQLGMLKLWERLKGTAALPQAAAVQEHDLERLREKLMLLDVEWHDGAPRYPIRYQGSDFDRMHNRNCVGLFLNEVMAPAVRERGLKTYRQVVECQTPAFNSTPVRGEDGAIVNYERLLLPFTRSGQGVEQIYCVITLFTEDNLSPFATMSSSASQGS
jgi:hypothetical protein